MVYVVLGMHKCGTTLTSQLLHVNGVKMIDYTPLPGELEYKHGGQYEAFSARMINEVLLNVRNVPSSKIRKRPLLEADRMKTCAQAYIDANKSYEYWGFKDPRTTLTYSEFWLDCLREIPHTVIVTYRAFEPFISRVAWYNLPQKVRMTKRYIEHYEECIEILKKDLPCQRLLFDFEDIKSNTSGFLSVCGLSPGVKDETVINNKLVRKVKLSITDRLLKSRFRHRLKAIELFAIQHKNQI